MTDFTPSETPDGYDFRGNRTENFVPEGTDVPAEVLAPLPEPTAVLTDTVSVASETGGYKGAGGTLRDDIRSRIKRVKPYSSVEVSIPEWDVTVEVRSLSLGDRDEMAILMVGEDGQNQDRSKFYPSIIMATTHDANGDKVFTPADLPWLRSLDAHLLDRIAKAAMELNGFTEKSGVEEAAGKSSETTTSESGSL